MVVVALLYFMSNISDRKQIEDIGYVIHSSNMIFKEVNDYGRGT